MKPLTVQKVRKAVQILAFIVFMFLFIQAVYIQTSRLPSDLFYRLDPLIALTASLAGRAVKFGLLYSLINLAATLIFGRVWCGWVCPFGSLLEWLAPLKNRNIHKIPGALRAVKYLLLTLLVTMAFFGNQSFVFLDPISILTRSMTTVLWPALRFGVFSVESFFYNIETLWPGLDWLNRVILLPVFQGIDSVFIASLPVLALLVLLFELNWLAERFWCRYLCPLGGMLALFARKAFIQRKVTETCIDCGKCAKICPTGTITAEPQWISDPGECTLCYDCAAICPAEAIQFTHQFNRETAKHSFAYDPARRQVLGASAVAVGSVLLAGVEPVIRRQPERLLRPPGALLTDFTSLCMRCGECVRVCPTQGLQPSLLEGGWQNVYTPHLVPRLGACTYACSACLQVCPTNAIPHLTLAEKQITTLGLASINTNRCLPWAYATTCSICEEICPLPEKAIKLEEFTTQNSQGEVIFLKRPRVDRDLCIGCGACEYHCPVGGEAAIQVFTIPTTEGYLRGI